MNEVLRDRYELLEILGEGGEARVVRAIDRQLGRTVALKIRPAPEGVARDELLREARVLLSLEPNPALPLVRDDFFAGSDYVIVMDWVDGVDLDRLLRERGSPGLAPTTVLRHLAHVAQALTHLHNHDPVVVHGDVKPANMILTGRGRIVLVDFGLAGSGANRANRRGTPGFVAPEVAAGSAPSRASDVYSLAMTAFALLTGEAHAGGSPQWPATIDTDRARVFERAIRLGTVSDPSARPASAGEFLELLRADWEADLPTGVLTFVMTDIEGSTSLWDRHAKAMPEALIRHDAILERIVESKRGHLIKSMGEGDSSVSVFASATDAVPAAAEIVRAVEAEDWSDGMSLRVRVGLHTGEAAQRGGDYFGPTVNLAARIRGEADGGHVLLSETTARLVDGHLPDGFALTDLGAHTLRGIGERQHIHALSAPFLASPPTPDTCPYRGLLAFEPEDEALFFGRSTLIADLVGRLSSGEFLAVVGASGSGKSSLVRAGLLAAARRGLVAGISSGLLITPATHAARMEALPDEPSQLLVVDQFEELFTLFEEETTRAEFIRRVLDRPGKVVVSLRADVYGYCAAYEELARMMAANHALLGPMSLRELRETIEAPARSAGLRLESGLIEVILRDAAGEPGALPLLSHALMETWARRDGRTLTLAGYRDAGGVQGAIARTAEELFGSFTVEEQHLTRRTFLRLTELGDGTEDTRRRVRLDELLSGEATGGQTRALLERLTRARLLTVDDDAAQVAHEALIREWPRLRAWLNEDRESLRLHRQLTQAASAWESSGHDPSGLYRGARLTAAEESVPSDALSADERSFIEASRAEEDRELREARAQARRLRRRLVGVAVTLVIAIVAGSLAVVARSNAQRSATVAQAGRLAALSREAAPNHPDLGLLLALEADRLDDSVDTRGALLGALQHASRMVVELGGFGSGLGTIAFTPDQKTFATVSLDGIRLWDTATKRPRGPTLTSSGSGWTGGAFSPDGGTFAVTNEQGNVELWDLSSQRMLRSLESPDGAWLQYVAYSPDGATIAAGGREVPHITLWNARTGRVIGTPITAKGPGSGGVHSFAFSPDSRTIVAPGESGKIAIWSVSSHRMVGEPITTGRAEVTSLAFTPEGKTVVAGDIDGTISLWDVRSRRPVSDALTVGNDAVGVVDVSGDGRFLAAGTLSGAVHVWDAASGEEFGPPLIADTTPINDVTFSPNGNLLATGHPSTLVLWDLSGRQAIGVPFGEERELVTDVSFRPDGGALAAAGFDGSIGLFDPARRAETARISGPSPVLTVRYSPDGKLIASGSLDGKVRLFDAATRALVGSLDVGAAWVWQVAFSPDGARLAVAVDPNGPRDSFNPDREGEVQLWDVASRRRVGRAMVPGKHAVTSVAFSPDGRLIASGSYEERTQLWDAANQERVGKPMDVKDDGTIALTFSADGARIVTAGAAVVRLWNAADQRLALPPLTGHTGGVVGASVDPHSRYLATTSQEGATRIWDARSGAPYGDELTGWKPQSLIPDFPLPAPFVPVRSAFSPDGRFLAVGGIANRPMIWDLSLQTWKTRACAIAGRNLTRAEWTRYMAPGSTYRRTCARWPAGPAA